MEKFVYKLKSAVIDLGLSFFSMCLCASETRIHKTYILTHVATFTAETGMEYTKMLYLLCITILL